jgi:hypothetical protein
MRLLPEDSAIKCLAMIGTVLPLHIAKCVEGGNRTKVPKATESKKPGPASSTQMNDLLGLC